MERFKRKLDLKEVTAKKSSFLFGARGSGKSTLIEDDLPQAKLYDLLDERTYLKLLVDSTVLEKENPSPNSLIVIDEIQKLPKLLDEVHRLIERKKHRFLLTGSSARKLKRSGANLLGGRAREYQLLPLVSPEVPGFKLETFLNRGGLPAIHLSDESIEDLKSYISLYLREEIAAEALTRRVDQFARFLDVIAQHSGEELHFQNLSSDSGVKVRTVESYVEILEDTLLGFRVHPFQATRKRKAITRSKFYLFDVGVTRALCRRPEIRAKNELFGRAFEHFLMLEIRAALSYLRSDLPIQYWRTKNGFEVDVVLGDELAIEIKSSSAIQPRHLAGLKALREERKVKSYCVVCDVPSNQLIDGIEIYPWKDFLERLWQAELF